MSWLNFRIDNFFSWNLYNEKGTNHVQKKMKYVKLFYCLLNSQLKLVLPVTTIVKDL